MFLNKEDLNSSNDFVAISCVSDQLVATSDVVIGGETWHMLEVMLFKEIWLERNYTIPLESFSDRLRGLAGRISRRPITSSDDSCHCTIL